MPSVAATWPMVAVVIGARVLVDLEAAVTTGAALVGDTGSVVVVGFLLPTGATAGDVVVGALIAEAWHPAPATLLPPPPHCA